MFIPVKDQNGIKLYEYQTNQQESLQDVMGKFNLQFEALDYFNQIDKLCFIEDQLVYYHEEDRQEKIENVFRL